MNTHTHVLDVQKQVSAQKKIDLVVDTVSVDAETPAEAGAFLMSRDGLEPSTLGLKAQTYGTSAIAG